MPPDDNLEDLLGVDSETATALQDEGFTSVNQIAFADPETLADHCDIGVPSAQEIVEAARSAEPGSSRHLDPLQSRRKLSTGCDAVDELLGGGIETHAVTEFVGPPGSGRTALAHLLAVRAQLPASAGGLGDQVIYVDTRGNFDPHQILGVVDALPPAEQDALAAHLDVDTEGDALGRAVLERIYRRSRPSASGLDPEGEGRTLR